MQHLFDVEVAAKFGVDLAIFLKNLAYWVNVNQANNINYRDGRYWTYNTKEAFSKIFPYWTVKQLRRIVEKGIEEGLIVKQSYNKAKYDRTLWYSLSDNGHKLLNLTNCPNGQVDLLERTNEVVEMGTPIPNTKPNTKQHIKIKSFSSSVDEPPPPEQKTSGIQFAQKKAEEYEQKRKMIERKNDGEFLHVAQEEKAATEKKKNEPTEWFDLFWAIYPRKEAKKDAIQAWNKNELDRLASEIILDVQERVKHHAPWKEKEFVMLPATYLRGERWKDEIIIKNTKQKGSKNEQRNNESAAAKGAKLLEDDFIRTFGDGFISR